MGREYLARGACAVVAGGGACGFLRVASGEAAPVGVLARRAYARIPTGADDKPRGLTSCIAEPSA